MDQILNLLVKKILIGLFSKNPEVQADCKLLLWANKLLNLEDLN